MNDSRPLPETERLPRHRHIGDRIKQDHQERTDQMFKTVAALRRGVLRRPHGIAPERIGQKLQDRDQHQRQPAQADDRAQLAEREGVGMADRASRRDLGHGLSLCRRACNARSLARISANAAFRFANMTRIARGAMVLRHRLADTTMGISEYATFDGLGLAELVTNRDVTPGELVEEAIARAERLNPKLNAVVFADYERARETARGQLPDGPFRGIPFFLKDVLGFAKGKPTRGRVSYAPDFGDVVDGLAIDLVVSRSVRDTAAALDRVAGNIPGDPYWAPPPDAYLAGIRAKPKKLRIAFASGKSNGSPLHPDCFAAVQAGAELCGTQGHIVEEASAGVDMPALMPPFTAIWTGNLAAGIDFAPTI